MSLNWYSLNPNRFKSSHSDKMRRIKQDSLHFICFHRMLAFKAGRLVAREILQVEKKTIAKAYSSPTFLHSGTNNWYSIFTCGTWRFSAKSFSSHTVLISVWTLELPRKIQEPYSGMLILFGQPSDVDLLFVSQWKRSNQVIWKIGREDVCRLLLVGVINNHLWALCITWLTSPYNVCPLVQ